MRLQPWIEPFGVDRTRRSLATVECRHQSPTNQDSRPGRPIQRRYVETIDVESSDGVTIVRLNRPPVNANTVQLGVDDVGGGWSVGLGPAGVS